MSNVHNFIKEFKTGSLELQSILKTLTTRYVDKNYEINVDKWVKMYYWNVQWLMLAIQIRYMSEMVQWHIQAKKLKKKYGSNQWFLLIIHKFINITLGIFHNRNLDTAYNILCQIFVVENIWEHLFRFRKRFRTFFLLFFSEVMWSLDSL